MGGECDPSLRRSGLRGFAEHVGQSGGPAFVGHVGWRAVIVGGSSRVGAAQEQQIDHRLVAVVGGCVQWRPAALLYSVRRRAQSEKQPREVAVPR